MVTGHLQVLKYITREVARRYHNSLLTSIPILYLILKTTSYILFSSNLGNHDIVIQSINVCIYYNNQIWELLILHVCAQTNSVVVVLKIKKNKAHAYYVWFLDKNYMFATKITDK